MQCRYTIHFSILNFGEIYHFIIIIRLQLAALHFNENANREQSRTKEGEEQYDIVFPKYKKGGYIVKKVISNPTYGENLLQL